MIALEFVQHYWSLIAGTAGFVWWVFYSQVRKPLEKIESKLSDLDKTSLVQGQQLRDHTEQDRVNFDDLRKDVRSLRSAA